MAITILIFLFYTALFIFILLKISKTPGFNLSFKEATLAFVVKIIAGCIYGYFFLHYYGGDDTWLYHNEALKQFELLKRDPLNFFTNDIIPHGYRNNPLFTIFSSSDSYFKDLELVLLLKLLAIFDLLSGGRYYVNVIFYNALIFWGSYFLFKSLIKKYPEKRNLWLLFVFYFPPLLFWMSGIRKDGLCFSVVCGLIYQLYILFEVKPSAKRIVILVCLFILLFLIRNYVALSFIPIIISYSLINSDNKNALKIFSIVLVCCGVLFFATALFPDSFNLPKKMAERQHAFLDLSGNSYLPIDSLDKNISYLKILPQALNHVFIRPYIFEAKGLLYIFSFIEILVFFFLIVRIIIKPSEKFKKLLSDPFILCLITIAFLNYIIIGYTVPFLGVIVRYKALFEIFFVIAFIQLQNTRNIDSKLEIIFKDKS